MSEPLDRAKSASIESILGAEHNKTAFDAGRWGRPLAWLGGIAALILLGAWLFGGSTTPVRYVTQPATTGSLVVTVTATGSVQPTNKVDVSSELSGTIRKVHVDYNTAVKAGQPLAELDTDKLRATVESSRARVAAAKARVADAAATVREKERDLARKRALADQDITSAQSLDLAKAAYDRALAAIESTKADVGVAEAELKLNETNLAKACICSPISGVVLKRNVDPGQTVASSLQAPVLFSIAEDLRQMELQVDIDEADVGKVKAGQHATFTVDAYPERRFPAVISDVRFASETIQGVVTYKAVLKIDNAELLLRPGMTATSDITVTEIKAALLLPNAALRYAPPAPSEEQKPSLLRRIMPGPPRFRPASQKVEPGPNRIIWVLKDAAPHPVKVVIGETDGKHTEIVQGDLQSGAPVIVDQINAKP